MKDNRISRHQAFMQVAEVMSQRSTCMRRAIGAVIVQNKTIISHGYNGPPSGEPHCFGKECAVNGVCVRSIHAEMNAINRMPPIDDADPELIMYSTESPCPDCAIAILNTLISSMYYLHVYRVAGGVDLVAARIPVFRMTPSGYVINHQTGELVDDVE